MINTTGIQSTGPQGLPGSPSQAAVVDEQDVAQFDAMMAQPKPSSSVEELKAKMDELKAKLETAMDNMKAANQTGDPKQIQNAVNEYRKIDFEYKNVVSLLEAVASSGRTPGVSILSPQDINNLW
jgi:archaellum component FlaC